MQNYTLKTYTPESHLDLSDNICYAEASVLPQLEITDEALRNLAKAADDDGKYHISDDEYMTVLNAVFCTVGWNLNDDVFIPEYMHAARNTPYLKPTNIDHLGSHKSKVNKTVGVILDAFATDSEYNAIESFDNLKHILIRVGLWTAYWPKEVQAVKERIAQGKQFVSMECLFSDFDYALKRVDASNKVIPGTETIVVPRTEESAKLTKFLRAYKGKGFVEIDKIKYKIGRAMKKIVFSGVALVERPADPNAIVFDANKLVSENFTTASMDFTTASVCESEYGDKMSKDQKETVVAETPKPEVTVEATVVSDMPSDKKEEVKAEMWEECEAYKLMKAELDKAKAECETLKASVKDMTEAMKNSNEALAAAKAENKKMTEAAIATARESRLANAGFVEHGIANLGTLPEDSFELVLAAYKAGKAKPGEVVNNELPNGKEIQEAKVSADSAGAVISPELAAASTPPVNRTKDVANAIMELRSKNKNKTNKK